MHTTFHVHARYRLEAYHKEYSYPNVTQARAHARSLRRRHFRTQIIKRTVTDEVIRS